MFLTIFLPELPQTYFWHNITAHKLLWSWQRLRYSLLRQADKGGLESLQNPVWHRHILKELF